MIDYTLPLEQLPDPLPIEPLTKPFDVTITPPGSKSITCRAYVLAALADGDSKIIRPLRADDTDNLLNALCTLGAEARWDGEDVLIKGVGGRFPRGGRINLGDGGAPTRFMIAAACLAAEPVIVDGSPRMRQRPIAEGVDMLRRLGAKIEYVEEEGRLPVRILPSAEFSGGQLQIGKTVSSQFISALMLIAPSLPTGLRLTFDQLTSASFVLLTSRILRAFCPRVKRNLLSYFSTNRLRTVLIPRQQTMGCAMSIEVDASSALYWALATMLVQRSRCTIRELSSASSQPDSKAIYALELLGEPIENYDAYDCSEDVDCLVINGPKSAGNRGLNADCEMMPDGSVALGVAASTCRARSRLTGLHTLRHKETDRIAALANELRKIGCTVETTDDSITIDPSTRHDKPVVIETYNDHRMAMSFAVLGLARPGISITNPACVSKSYPTFWKDFAKLYQ